MYGARSPARAFSTQNKVNSEHMSVHMYIGVYSYLNTNLENFYSLWSCTQAYLYVQMCICLCTDSNISYVHRVTDRQTDTHTHTHTHTYPSSHHKLQRTCTLPESIHVTVYIHPIVKILKLLAFFILLSKLSKHFCAVTFYVVNIGINRSIKGTG